MNTKQTIDLRNRISRACSARRITEALNLLSTLASATSAPWSITEEIDRLRDLYNLMCRYALDGIQDPDRERVYASIVADIALLADVMARHAAASSETGLYFDAVRYASLHPEAASVTRLTRELAEANGRIGLQALTGQSDIEALRGREALEGALFKALWTTHPLPAAHAKALADFLQADTTPGHQRLLLISALLMGLLQYYDPRKMDLLLDLYMQHADGVADAAEAMRAATALVIALWVHRGRELGRDVRLKLAAAADMPSWNRDIRTASLMLLRTRDTEKITRTMQEDLIPSMLRLRPDIYGKISNDAATPLDLDNLADGENPEWQEMLERSGLNEKLRRLSEMQEQGGDVMMATFSHLKTFPFFHDIASWFMPMHEDHSLIEQLRRSSGDAAVDMVLAAEFICSSDRFSMLLSIESLPSDKRRMMLSQFESQNLDMAQLRGQALDPEADMRELHATNYVRDLYRFFHLYRRKGEFDGSFFDTFNPTEVEALQSSFDSTDSLELVAEFFFRHGYHADALTVFSLMDRRGLADASLYQKMGYAAQQLGQLDQALAYYEKAEMLDPNARWTWRRLAALYRLTGQPQRALAYLDRLLHTKPDDLTLTLQKANTLAETGAYADALKLYFKVEFLDPDSQKAIRPIAWTAFLSGDYDTAHAYMDRIAEPTAADLLNRGHLAMATGHYHEAIEIYRHAIEAPGWSKAEFAKAMQQDLPHLRAAKVPDLVTGIVIDRLLDS